MISDDEYLERIVAGIHSITTTNAEVNWNEYINGRQFDVVIRFKLGSLRYLVVVEVKNRMRKSGAADMEGFVQKARDQNANKAVFVTAAGFQEGAIKIAKRHGIELFTISFDDNRPTYSPATNVFLHDGHTSLFPKIEPQIVVGEPQIMHNITHATLVYTDGRKRDLPSEVTQMTYYCERSQLADGWSLAKLIEDQTYPNLPIGDVFQVRLPLEPASTITPPDEYFFPKGEVGAVEITIEARRFRPLSGNTKVEPSAFATPVIYTNVLTGESSRFGLTQLPLGGRASVGAFYFQYHPLRYYYCDAIKGLQVRWVLVESFQHAQLITASMMIDVKYSSFFIPVADKKIVNRLQRRLEDYRALSAGSH